MTVLSSSATARDFNSQFLITHVSNSLFRFPPMVLEYTSRPSQVRCSASDPASMFQGFEHTTAAFKTQLAPSSPRYYAGREDKSDSKMWYSLTHYYNYKTYIRQYVCTQRVPDCKQRSVWELFSQPFHHLSDIPGGPSIVQNTAGNGALSTSP